MDPRHTHIDLNLHSYTLNLLSMATGKGHPLARSPELSLPFTQADDFEMKVNGVFVGLLVMHALEIDGTELWSPIMVWNWKTGVKVYVSTFLAAYY